LFNDEIEGAMQQAPQPGRQAKDKEGCSTDIRALSQAPAVNAPEGRKTPHQEA